MRKDQKGTMFVEAAVVIPLLMVFMLLLMYYINIFFVQSVVQFGLNQTVNELGNYTYFLDVVGLIDKSNSANSKLKAQTDQGAKDAQTLTTAYNSVVGALSTGSSTVETLGDNISSGNLSADVIQSCITGLSDTKNAASQAKNDVSTAWDMVKDYAKNPSKLIELIKSQAALEAKNAGHSLLGALLGKLMLQKYVSGDILEKCGVVSTNYNGQCSKDEYSTGISGMDFSASNFLGDMDTRVIDLIVYYRIKFPFNVSGWFGVTEGGLYDNSMLIVQRAAGYGWVNGDGKGKGADAYNN